MHGSCTKVFPSRLYNKPTASSLPSGAALNFQKICVIGLGYIGLPTASTFATHGLKVAGVDTDPNVIEALREGKIQIHEPGLGDVVTRAIRSGNFRSLPDLRKRTRF